MDYEYDKMNTEVQSRGEPKIESPIQKWEKDYHGRDFVSDSTRVLIDVDASRLEAMIREGETLPSFELAGPRSKIYFDPSKLKCALVTCGGLCPGLNGIIRSIVLQLFFGYGVRNVYGIRYGLQGFIPKYGHKVIELTPEAVTNIIRKGGSFLGSSRGPQNIDEIIDCLE
ncbi:MAG: ATP-dependent 6-phosphofructokinase, partial [Deltaproteobacteria bacterium]